MVGDPGSLAAARRALDRSRWVEAADAYAATDADDLDPDDLRRWATACYLVGRMQACLDALVRAHRRLTELGQVDEAVVCGFWISYALINSGRPGQAEGWLERCRGQLEDRTRSLGAGYLLTLDAFSATAIEHDEQRGRALAEQAVAVGRAEGDADLVALALSVLGRALIRSGDVRTGLARLDEAMVAVVADEVSPQVAGTVYCSVIDACEEVLALDRAAEWTAALSAWCDRQHGMVTFNGQCVTHRASVLRVRGELGAAEAEAEHACERFAGAADEAGTGEALYELGEVRRLRGDLSGADRSYADAAGWGRDPQPGLALLRLAQGRRGEAVAMVRRREQETRRRLERLRLLPAHVEIMLVNDDLGEAQRAVAELTAIADVVDTAAAHAEADGAAGAVALATGRAGAALVALRRAFLRWQGLGAPREAARCRMLVARACAALGDHDAAAQEEAAARRALIEVGAHGDLAVLGGRPVRDVAGLTPRELEVLGLVAAGLTNRAIAAELGISVRTVDRHVTNILARLGVASRTAAATAGHERGLLPPG